ncbi:hypothetical protein KP509_33G028300 [Ceratopteris richardii]|nr:hypothetical protein KP509_33G028300 [Ceratopteris richardii]
MYAKCGSLKDARVVFDALPTPSVVTWTLMIVGFTEHALGWEALQLFWLMESMGTIEPDKTIFVCVLKVCSSLNALDEGYLVHARVVEAAHEKVLTVNNTLIDMYAKYGCLEDARNLFQSNSERSLVTWNTMIAAFSHQQGQEQEAFHLLQVMRDDGMQPSNLTWNAMISGLVQQGQAQQALQLYWKLLGEGILPDAAIFISVLKGCSVVQSVELGWVTHSYVIEMHHDLDITVCNTLIDMYGRCASLQDARNVFDCTSKQNVISWTTMISSYLQRQLHEEAFLLFEQMKSYGVEPNYVTFLSMIKGCSNQASLMWARAIHDHIIKFKFEMDTFVCNSLIDMYTKCGTLEDACSVFDNMPRKCVVAWTAIIAGFAQNGHIKQADSLFKHMQKDGVKPNIFTWNAMLAGTADHGHDVECLYLFQQMQERGVEVDEMTLVSVVKSCGNLALLNLGSIAHHIIIETSLEHDVHVCNTLIDMYVKCGSIIHAKSLFNTLPKQKVEAWNALLGGYPDNLLNQVDTGNCSEKLQCKTTLPSEFNIMDSFSGCSGIVALTREELNCALPSESRSISSKTVCIQQVSANLEDAYKESKNCSDQECPTLFMHKNNPGSLMEILNFMHATGSKPDDITFISLLSSCCEMGLLHMGCELFSSMTQDFGITPKLDHFNCLVSLISNSGCWNEAEDLLQTMPFPADIIGWTSLLCRSHGNIDLGERCFEQVISLDNRDAAGFQQMADMYSDAGMWRGADRVENWRQFLNSWKKPGKACVEIDEIAHVFVVGDKTHSQIESVYLKMHSLNIQLKLEGYTPQPPIHKGLDECMFNCG